MRPLPELPREDGALQTIQGRLQTLAQGRAGQAADLQMSASPKHPMTAEQMDAIDMMMGTTFPVASWDKRFFRHLMDCRETGQIGEKSVPQLWRIFIKYRRQHRTEFPQRRAELLRIAETLSAPDLRKVAAAQAEQNRIDEMKASIQTP